MKIWLDQTTFYRVIKLIRTITSLTREGMSVFFFINQGLEKIPTLNQKAKILYTYDKYIHVITDEYMATNYV